MSPPNLCGGVATGWTHARGELIKLCEEIERNLVWMLPDVEVIIVGFCEVKIDLALSLSRES